MAVPKVAQKLVQLDFIALALVCLLLYLFTTAVYNLYFHPLADVPGPFWAGCSTIPSWWHTRKQNRHLWLLSLQKKYGQYHLLTTTDTAELTHQVHTSDTGQTVFASTHRLHIAASMVHAVTSRKATYIRCGRERLITSILGTTHRSKARRTSDGYSTMLSLTWPYAAQSPSSTRTWIAGLIC